LSRGVLPIVRVFVELNFTKCNKTLHTHNKTLHTHNKTLHTHNKTLHTHNQQHTKVTLTNHISLSRNTAQISIIKSCKVTTSVTPSNAVVTCNSVCITRDLKKFDIH